MEVGGWRRMGLRGLKGRSRVTRSEMKRDRSAGHKRLGFDYEFNRIGVPFVVLH